MLASPKCVRRRPHPPCDGVWRCRGVSAQERDPGKDELSASVKTHQEAGGAQTANLPAAGSSQLLELRGTNVCCFSHRGSHTALAAGTKTHAHAHMCTHTCAAPHPPTSLRIDKRYSTGKEEKLPERYKSIGGFAGPPPLPSPETSAL